MAKHKKDLPPVHPGEILREEFLKPLNLTMNRLALDLHVPANRISQIVEGERAVSADTALRLARYFGTTPDLWLGMQMQYDLETATDQLAGQIEREVRPREAKAA
jgi:addiction module HigA family antidote